jgi:amidase
VTLDDYARLDATGLAAALARGEATPAGAADLARAAADRVNPVLNAIVDLWADTPEAQGPPADAPFAGVPFLYKDAGAAEAGRPQELGSRLAVGRTAPRTRELARRFRAAGLVPVGRSAAPEFSLSLTTESVLRGATGNPWDPSRLAGGSSGGAAAAVAAGVVPVAHATDAAGSIRIPASACGLVGLKPSRSRIAPHPDDADALLGMDTEFVLTRSVRDAAGLLAVLGPPPDAEGGERLRALAEDRARSTPPVRIAVCGEAWNGERSEGEVERALRRTADLLGELGHTVIEDRPPLDYDAFVDAATIGWAIGFDRYVERIAADLGRPVDDTTLEPVTLDLVERARRIGRSEADAARAHLEGVQAAFARFFGEVDVLLTPTLTRPPEPLGVYAQEAGPADFDAFFRHCDRTGAFLPPFNAGGQPALTLPLGWSRDGLPLGMQVVGPIGAEVRLLELAADLERAAPWGDRRPPVHAAAGTGGTT